IKAFAAVWLERPHAAHGHIDRLRRDVPEAIFNDEHEPLLYVTAAHLLVRAREVVGKGRYPALYHLCFAARLFADGGARIGPLSGLAAEKRAQRVAALAADRRAGRRLVEHAKKAVTGAKRDLGHERLSASAVRVEGFTEQVRAHALRMRGTD
ncbi:MAG: hypothetical protein MI723_11440, partial [Caulobacterales bacterium]|nr:hypothetical protein [Caulobacterales bacterium]